MRPALILLPLALGACKPDDDVKDTGEIPDPCADAGADIDFTTVREAMEDSFRGSYATGASVAIWKDGCVVFAEGFGSRHPDRDEPVDTTTLFQIGSDTKKITALALLQQVDHGLLSLDRTLSQVLPDLHFALEPAFADTTTVRHLLTHTTGFYDYTPWSSAPDDSALADIAYGRFAENQFWMMPPGQAWNYSNPNFSVAGLVTEEVAGRPWADVMEQDVFAPLGLTRSFARLSEVAADGDYATGYGVVYTDGYDSFDILGENPDYSIGTLEMEDQVDNAFTRPAGLVWSTATDMVKLAGFLMNGDESVLSSGLLAEVTASQVPLYPMAPDFGSYGMGVMITDGFWGGNDYFQTPTWSHGGNTMTMTSGFYALPALDMAMSILSNGYGDDFTAPVLEAFHLFATDLVPSEGPAWPDAGDLSRYAGTYLDPHAIGEVTLTWDGTALSVSMPAIEDYGWRYDDAVEVYGEDYLVVTVEGTPFEFFVVDGTDGVTEKYLVNRLFVATRQEGAAGPVHPDPSRLLPVLMGPQPRLVGPR